MRKMLRIALLLVIVASTVLVAAPAHASPPPPVGCQTGWFSSPAAKWMICIPAKWNGDLLVYAHGYIPYSAPLDLQHLELSDGTKLQDIVQSLGFAFATTSYRQNGLAALTAVEDVRQVALYFETYAGVKPAHTYLAGVSEGGLVTTLGVEKYPDLFSGGAAACGPIGDFQKQTNYFGDFRVLYDYFFPGVLPASPIKIPSWLIANWDPTSDTCESTACKAAIKAVTDNPAAAKQLIRVSQAPVDSQVPSTVLDTVTGLLWYSVWATNDASDKLGGNPYGNRRRIYLGSKNDFRLNAPYPFGVQRFSAAPAALTNLAAYQTSGVLEVPLVTLHTTGDPIVPFWHQAIYKAKTKNADSSKLTVIPIFRYGHCSFEAVEVVAAFGLLVYKVTGTLPLGVSLPFNPDKLQQDFERAALDFGKAPAN